MNMNWRSWSKSARMKAKGNESQWVARVGLGLEEVGLSRSHESPSVII